MSSNLDQLTADAMKLPLRDRVQLAQRLVSTIDDEEYFHALLQEQQRRKAEEKLEGLLLEGLATESSALDEKDWEHMRTELENRISNPK
jgi:antitoxin ParD1/3/4